MLKDMQKRLLSLIMVSVMVLAILPAEIVNVHGATETLNVPSDGLTVSYDSGDNITWALVDTRDITGDVTPTTGCSTTAVSSTLTLKNTLSVSALVTFSYDMTLNSGTVKIDGESKTAAGSFSKVISAGGTVTVAITSYTTEGKHTIVNLKNIQLVNAAAEPTVTFTPAESGSYTVNGTKITSATAMTNASSVAYTLSASPASGYKFMGWYNGDTLLSATASATLYFGADASVTAKFILSTTAVFSVDKVLFTDLNEAVKYATDNSKSTIVLSDSGTLPAGSYTIPSGKTLLIPFDSYETLYTTAPGYQTSAATQSAYKTLTMANGASITVKGAISIGSKVFTSGSQDCCKPTGPYGLIKMEGNSAITLKSGSKLYAWGYITGSGSVTAEKGSYVYECFQIRDWRGGNATSSLYNNSQKVFPFNQYFVLNIQVPLTLQSGATEIAYLVVTAGGSQYNASITFVGSGGLFELADGSTFAKKYNSSTGRTTFITNGNISLSSIKLSVVVTVDSSSYILPICNYCDLVIESGTAAINNEVSLLAGVSLTVNEGAELNLKSNSILYIYDADEWKNTYANGGIHSSPYSPTGGGKTITTSDVKVDINGAMTVDGNIYTTAGGADICSSKGTGKIKLNSAPGTKTNIYQATQSGTSISYEEVSITPAKLHNNDKSYTNTSDASSGDTVLFNTVTGKWELPKDTATVTFDTNGGSWSDGTNESKTLTGTYTSVPVPDAPTKACHEFAGWNITSGTGSFSADGDMFISGSVSATLTAEWTESEHTWDNGTVTKAATCISEGEMIYKCTLCGKEKTEIIPIDSNNHGDNTEIRDIVNATCTAVGYSGDTYCLDCGAKISVGEEIPVNPDNHNWSEVKVIVQPTCTESGYQAAKCSLCGEEKDKIDLEPLGHKEYISKEAKAKTCTEDGWTEEVKCSVCGETVKVSEELPAFGHTWSDWEIITENGCVNSGLKRRICATCGETEDYVTNPNGHKEYISKEAKAPTCTEDGWTQEISCSVCGGIIEPSGIIPAFGHSWSEWNILTEPDCTNTGFKTRECTICGVIEEEVIPAVGHIDEDGDAYCDVCGILDYYSEAYMNRYFAKDLKSDELRCKMCTKSEISSNTFIGQLYTIIHIFVHLARYISYLT